MRAARITSGRALVGVILAALITTAATIGIKSCPTEPLSLTFIGRVVNEETKEKIYGAKVILEGEAAPPLILTDAEGIFSFPVSDRNKELRLRVEANGYQTYELRVVPAKNHGIQDVLMRPQAELTAELSGTVVDRNDKPLAGARVTLDDPPGMAAVETSSNGVFNLTAIPRKHGERVRLRVVLAGYQPNPYTDDVVLGASPPLVKLRRAR